MANLDFINSKQWLKISTIATAAATIAILFLTFMLVTSTNEMTDATQAILDFSEKSLKVEEESKALELASIESQHSGFRADLDYWFYSIKKSDSGPYQIHIRNNAETETYLKHRLYLTASCDIVPSDVTSIDEKIIDDEEMAIKFEKRNSLEFTLPDDLLDPYLDTFGLRLTVVSHPNLSSGFLESVSDNKVTHIQYVLSEDLDRWQPTVVTTDGGFQCGREPYGSDMNRVEYTNEEDFVECSACK